MTSFFATTVEETFLACHLAQGPAIALKMITAKRHDFGDMELAQRLCDALLPKFISSELRIENAETLSEASV